MYSRVTARQAMFLLTFRVDQRPTNIQMITAVLLVINNIVFLSRPQYVQIKQHFGLRVNGGAVVENNLLVSIDWACCTCDPHEFVLTCLLGLSHEHWQTLQNEKCSA